MKNHSFRSPRQGRGSPLAGGAGGRQVPRKRRWSKPPPAHRAKRVYYTDLCQELQAQLPDYLDGEAKEAICRAIETHLASCEDCRVVVDTMKKTITLYRNAPRETVPRDVHARLVRVLKLDELSNKPQADRP